MYNTKTYTEECGYLVIQQASLIFNNNNMTSHNFNSFSDVKNIFLEHSGFPPVLTFLSHFYQKTSVEANVNVAAILTQHFVRNCSQFVIL